MQQQNNQPRQRTEQHIVRLDDDAIDRIGAQLETAAQSCAIEQVQALPALKQSVLLARGIAQIKSLLTDDVMREVFMPLRGSRLGFKTDRDNEEPERRYGVAIVREVLTEALIRGLRPVGNEFNIIAGNFYQTLEGFERKVRELAISELELRPSVPLVNNGVALVEYRATWLRDDGTRDKLECIAGKREDNTTFDERIPVRVNNGMGPDAVLGKAKRKFLARLYHKVTGVRSYDGDAAEAIETDGVAVVEAPTPRPAQSQAERIAAERLAQKKPAERTREPGED